MSAGTLDAPTTVHADASASTGSNGTPIASYTFNFGDGPVVGSQASPTADYTFGGVDGFTMWVTVTVTDTAGRTSTTTRQFTTAQRIFNASFESGSDGWDAAGSSHGVTSTRGNHSHSGYWAADLENGATAGATCVLNDAPNWISTTENGQYSASLWARAADLTGANIALTLTLREYRKDTGAATAACAGMGKVSVSCAH